MIGSILDGRYEILAEIGAGQVGTVYRARHLLIGRMVAIKMLHAEFAGDEKRRQRFRREAKVVGALNHPGIIKVHDSGLSADGRPYLVMDLAEGESLAALIAREGHLPVERAVDIAAQCCRALWHAHQQGVVHRDLRPSKVILGAESSEIVRIVDFGIAAILVEDATGDQSLTATALASGSPLYTSPELCMGRLVDAGSDIYSLGCILYEMLTGSAPFQGDSPVELASKHVAQLPLPIGEAGVKPVVPEQLEEAVFKAMEKDRKKRFGSMNEFLAALVSAVGDLTVRQRTLSSEPLSRVSGKLTAERKGMYALIIVSLLVSAGLVALFFTTPAGELLLASWRFELLATFNHTDMRALSDSLDEIISRSTRSGVYRPALSAARKRLALLRSQLGPNAPEIVAASLQLADLCRAAGNNLEACALYDWAIPILENELGRLSSSGSQSDVIKATRQLVDIEESFPNRYGERLMYSTENLGRLYSKSKRHKEALDYLNRALAIRSKLRGKDDLRVGETYHHIALAYLDAGDRSKAAEYFRKAFAIEDQDKSFEDYGWLCFDYLVFCAVSRNLAEFERSWDRFLKDEHAAFLSDEQLQVLAGAAAQGYIELRQWKEAERALNRARALILKSDRKNPDALLQGSTLLGVVCREQRRYAESEKHFLAAAQMAKEFGKPIAEVNALAELGDLRRMQNRFDLASNCDKEAWAVLQKSGNVRTQSGVGLLCRLAEDLTASGNVNDGEKTVKECLQLMEQVPGLEPGLRAACYCARAEVEHAKKNYKEAAQGYGQAAEIAGRLGPAGDSAHALYLTRQGMAYTADNQFEAAERSFKSALSICRKPDYRGDRNFLLEQYRQLCLKTEKLKEAAELEAEMRNPLRSK